MFTANRSICKYCNYYEKVKEKKRKNYAENVEKYQKSYLVIKIRCEIPTIVKWFGEFQKQKKKEEISLQKRRLIATTRRLAWNEFIIIDSLAREIHTV